MSSRRLRLGCLVSGAGRTLLNLADEIDAGRLNAEIALVVAARSGVAAIDAAKARGLTTFVAVEPGSSSEPPASPSIVSSSGPPRDRSTAVDDAIDDALRRHRVDLVCLCGFLRYFRLGRWRGRTVNIHPSLLPRHGGAGMYGERVHRSVLEAGDPESGCSVHLVDDQYDHGPILLQRRCPVLAGDTPATLAARVFELEKATYPEALRRIASGETQLDALSTLAL